MISQRIIQNVQGKSFCLFPGHYLYDMIYQINTSYLLVVSQEFIPHLSCLKSSVTWGSNSVTCPDWKLWKIASIKIIFIFSILHSSIEINWTIKVHVYASVPDSHSSFWAIYNCARVGPKVIGPAIQTEKVTNKQMYLP